MADTARHNPVTPLPTMVIRHRGEKAHKCSILPLRGRADFVFHVYPVRRPLDLDGYVRLGIGGPPLTPADGDKGLLVLDASWRNVQVMERVYRNVPVRSLPPWRTAYPRASKTRQDPAAGLATIEAVFIALIMLGRDPSGILDHYVWRKRFIELNRELIEGGPR